VTIEPFPLIDIAGSPRERGRQYGRKTADRIAKGRSHYRAQLERLALGAAELSRWSPTICR
jgi:isopenicillin-N N-acyltransferase-like protein